MPSAARPSVADQARQPRYLLRLSCLAAVSILAYVGVALTGQSLHEEGTGGTSLLAVLALFGAAFGCHLLGLRWALRAGQDRRLLAVIAGAAVAYRLVLLASDPIEEIDLYRYLWDGAASNAGVNPFRYSPQQVLAASADDELPADLARLVALRDRSPALAEVLSRVHFGELPTIYPPVSQAVFAAAAFVTPENASTATRMTIMKAWFVAFDLATLGLVVGLLRRAGRPIGWALAYGWCPLVIKEFANSGHLDSLAVFLATWALSASARGLYDDNVSSFDPTGARRTAYAAAAIAAASLALATGAKLYPVIFAPLLLVSWWARRGWRPSAIGAFVYVALASCVLWPMLAVAPGKMTPWAPEQQLREGDSPLPPRLDTAPRDPSLSLRAFLSDWEMNDFLFLLVMENVRPTASLTRQERAWFSIVPESWRADLDAKAQRWFGASPPRSSFFVARGLMAAVFLALAAAFGARARRAETTSDWLEAAFLTVAWFWLLLPTANPWYWTWAAPLLLFARGRAWLALSGLVFLYYLRFWLGYHFPDAPVLGTPYAGRWFFDYVVTWVEYGPWFAWLGWHACARCRLVGAAGQ